MVGSLETPGMHHDLAILGAGLGGSITALVAKQMGLNPILIERGKHPRFAIGESATPQADIALANIAKTYNLDRLAPITRYGSWKETYPTLICGPKRGFTYINHPHIEDEFIESEISFQDYLTEIIRSFEEISEKDFFFITEKNTNPIKFRKSVEINYGLRNFIGNANKFSKQKIEIKLLSDEKNTEIQISDDGPGFPNDIIDKLGEPYIISSYQEIKSKIGLGLGTFIGKTLLEKNYGKINFKNISETKGALVNISWLNTDLKRI